MEMRKETPGTKTQARVKSQIPNPNPKEAPNPNNGRSLLDGLAELANDYPVPKTLS